MKVMAVLDSFKRKIDYLRISVTDRCNFRCAYCMPPGGISRSSHRDMLTYEEVLRIVRVLSSSCGITRIRLTGGEPLVRKGLIGLVQGIAAMGTIQDIAMTTNGSLLAEQARELKQAGLRRVNISLDTLDADVFSQITCGGKLEATLAGINSALAAGLSPVKINTVLTEALSVQDLEQFLALIYKSPLLVRFIEYMPVGYPGIKPGMTPDRVKRLLSNRGQGILHPVEAKVEGGGPAKYFTLPGAKGAFGFIAPVSEHFCHTCNRIRLTADGKLRPCLLSNQEVDIKSELRSGADDESIIRLFFKAVQQKPAGHRLEAEERQSFGRRMSQIGG